MSRWRKTLRKDDCEEETGEGGREGGRGEEEETRWRKAEDKGKKGKGRE